MAKKTFEIHPLKPAWIAVFGDKVFATVEADNEVEAIFEAVRQNVDVECAGMRPVEVLPVDRIALLKEAHARQRKMAS